MTLLRTGKHRIAVSALIMYHRTTRVKRSRAAGGKAGGLRTAAYQSTGTGVGCWRSTVFETERRKGEGPSSIPPLRFPTLKYSRL